MIVSVAEYKAWAGITGAALDARLAVVTANVDAEINARCSRDAGGFDSAARTETIDGDAGPSLRVRYWPITALTSIAIREGETTTTYDASSSPTLVDTFGFMSDRSGRIYVLGSSLTIAAPGQSQLPRSGYSPRFPRGLSNITVQYTGGYAAVPPDLKKIAYELIAAEMAQVGYAGRPDSTFLVWSALGGASRSMRATHDIEESITRRLRPYMAVVAT